MVREERSDYPYKAVREVLVNALIHRDYQILGSEIHVDIFDNRMEISSPGGMINGKRIQDMNLHHIPSMRRNQVISDVFARLDFMERRGSGIDRILNSYLEVTQKPDFYSDTDFFLVTLPNRSIAVPAQLTLEDMDFSEENFATSPRNFATFPENFATSPENFASQQYKKLQDMERKKFQDSLKPLPLNKKTKSRVEALFYRYGYEYSFHSNNAADVFGIKQSAATYILRKLREADIIQSPQYGLYQFKRK